MADDWHITHQKLDTVLNDEGNGFTQQWNVGYMIHSGPAEGVKGEVHVKNSELDAGRVNDAITRQVAKHQAVAAL